MTHKSWWTFLGILFGLSLALRASVGPATVLFLFTTLLAIASGASVLWYRFCLHGVTYRRELREERIFCGEGTELTIKVTNAKPLPLAWLLIRDSFPKDILLLTGALQTAGGHTPSGEQSTSDRSSGRDLPEQERPTDQGNSVQSLTDVLSLRWYERVQRTYRIQSQKRGVYTFGPADITSGDIFGFGQRHASIKEQDRLIVYPKVVPVERLGLPSQKPAGELAAQRKIVEDPLRMATVREYVPGDSIRYIHWKNTARLNQLQTKVFDASASPVLTLLIDLQTVHNPYGYVPEYLELIISAAASIAVHALDQRQAVGLYANGGPSGASYWTSVAPGRSPGQGAQILTALAPLSGFRLLPLYQLLRRAMPALPYGCTAVVITARPVEQNLVSLLTLQDAGHPTVLFTVGDQEPEIPAVFDTFHLGGRDAWRRLETLELA
jgi:uncharacterized protein (DUF58 family)